MRTLSPSSLEFLAQLSQHNRREWFDQHRDEYLAAKANVEAFALALAERMAMDSEMKGVAPKYKLFRLFRDVRFSKNKEPFKTNFGIILGGGDNEESAKFYLHLSPKESFIGGGIYHPSAPRLHAIRQKIAKQYETLDAILSDKGFKQYFTFEGEQLKTAPKGYAKDHPAMKWLRHKDFLATRPLTTEHIIGKKFASECHTMFKRLQPFISFFNEA